MMTKINTDCKPCTSSPEARQVHCKLWLTVLKLHLGVIKQGRLKQLPASRDKPKKHKHPETYNNLKNNLINYHFYDIGKLA